MCKHTSPLSPQPHTSPAQPTGVKKNQKTNNQKPQQTPPGVFLYPEQREGGREWEHNLSAWFLLAPPNPLQPEQGQETQKHLPQVQTTAQALQVLSSCHQAPVEELEPQSHCWQQFLSGVKSKGWECWIQGKSAPAPSGSCPAVESSFSCKIKKG